MEGNMLLLFLAIWPIIGSIIGYMIGRKDKNARDYFVIFVTVVEFIAVLALYPQASNQSPAYFKWLGFSGFDLHLKLDGFRYIYALIAAFMWMMTTIFSREYFSEHYRNRNRYYLFTIMTLGATIGVLTSADLITTFIFFEIMSFTSYVMVIHDETKKAKDASAAYMAVAVIGGLVMLMGIFLIQHNLGTTDMALLLTRAKEFTGDKNILYIAAILMMVGFGGKAGMFPIHIWLPTAHPAAPAPASSLLSGILTKTGIFGALVISSKMFLHDSTWGIGMLVVGVITMILGAFLAVFSIDLKRTLALSSVSQIGFIVLGIGMQGILGANNSLAVRGTLLHMLNHSMIKLVLFMAAGVIYMKLHALDLNEIRGYGRGKPILAFIFGMGALSIIGMPLWSGYISKTLLHGSILDQIFQYTSYTDMSTFYRAVDVIFTLSGGLTTAYMTKLFVAIFIEKHPYEQDKMDSYNKNYMTPLSVFALGVPAVMLFVLGAIPKYMDNIATFGQVFMNGQSPAEGVNYFDPHNLMGAVATLSIGMVVYFLIIRGVLMDEDENGNMIYIDAWPSILDIEKLIYRPLLQYALPFLGALFSRTIAGITTLVGAAGNNLFKITKKRIYKPWKRDGVSGYEYSDVEDYEGGNIEKLISSSLSFGILQFAVGLVTVSLIVILIQNLS